MGGREGETREGGGEKEREREGGREGGRDGGTEGGREGEGEREGERKGGRERGREGRKKGGREEIETITIITPHDKREENERQCDNMVGHHYAKVHANGLNVERGIGGVEVEPHLEHVEPVERSIHMLTWVPV